MKNFCIKCNKNLTVPRDKSISCKKCTYNYHLSCSELNENKFHYYQNYETEKWECMKCIKNSCRKCNSSIHHKASIRWKIPVNYKNDKIFTSSWICPICKPNILPFASLTDTKVIELSNHRLDKYSRDSISSTDYSRTCSVCYVNLKRNNPGVPCSCCKSKIHVKCSDVPDPKRNFHLYRGNWQCSRCMSSQYPFFDIDKNILIEEFTHNSNNPTTEQRFKPEVTIEEKLKLMLSYSKQSPWYAYTHPDEKREYDFFTDEIDESLTIKPHFDYYDIDGFKKIKSLWNKKKTFSLIHTNVCSLQANIDQLEDLLFDLDFSFDVIALSETWHSDKTQNFSPKRLEGYLEYNGAKGSSLKGGCGFYIKDTFTPIPRNDLDFKIPDQGCETECCWIELVNNPGPNILVGVFYRHPSRNNNLFVEKLKVTLKKINREKKKQLYVGISI